MLLEIGRESTIDIDLKLDPEPPGVFEAIAHIKNSLNLNIELASPDQFIPELPGWRNRSPFIQTVAQIEFRHYDFYSQALAKIERGHDRDLDDVSRLLSNDIVERKKLSELFQAISDQLIRYPSINIPRFTNAVSILCET